MFNIMTQQIKIAVAKGLQNAVLFGSTSIPNKRKNKCWKNLFQNFKEKFPNKNEFYKIFNKNNVKLSNSCIKNMAAIRLKIEKR